MHKDRIVAIASSLIGAAVALVILGVVVGAGVRLVFWVWP